MPDIKEVDEIPEQPEKQLITVEQCDIILTIVRNGNHLKADVTEALVRTIKELVSELARYDVPSPLLERLRS